jgi:hypothetical protein
MKVQIIARLISDPARVLRGAIEEIEADDYEDSVSELAKGFEMENNGFMLWNDNGVVIINSKDISHLDVEIIEK